MASSDFRAWRMEKAKTAAFCGKALEDALARHGKPEASTPIRAASSPARRPALAASKTITRLRRGCRVQVAKTRRSLTSPMESIFACLRRLYVDELRAEPNQRQRLRKWVCHTCQTLERTSPVRAIIRPAAASALHRLPFNVVEVHCGNPRLPVI